MQMVVLDKLNTGGNMEQQRIKVRMFVPLNRKISDYESYADMCKAIAREVCFPKMEKGEYYLFAVANQTIGLSNGLLVTKKKEPNMEDISDNFFHHKPLYIATMLNES